MNRNDDARTIEAVAEATGTDAVWLSNVFGRLSISVDATTRRFASVDFERALEEAAQMASQGGPHALLSDAEKDQLVVIAQMGQTPDTLRNWLRERFSTVGLRVASQGGRDYALYTLEKEIDRESYQLKVQTHSALKAKPQSGQISFSVAGIKDKDVPWHVFACRPWGRAFLRSRKEIESAMREKKDIASITFSAGSSRDLFEDRLADLTRDPAWKKVTR
jgi:hypothetical protein